MRRWVGWYVPPCLALAWHGGLVSDVDLFLYLPDEPDPATAYLYIACIQNRAGLLQLKRYLVGHQVNRFIFAVNETNRNWMHAFTARPVVRGVVSPGCVRWKFDGVLLKRNFRR